MNNESRQTDEEAPQNTELLQQAKETMDRLYGLLDGTVCSSKEHAVIANYELAMEYTRR